MYEIDLASIYFMYNHEIFMGWLGLYDLDGESENLRGFLKVIINIKI
jgi:hypothetical protein